MIKIRSMKYKNYNEWNEIYDTKNRLLPLNIIEL